MHNTAEGKFASCSALASERTCLRKAVRHYKIARAAYLQEILAQPPQTGQDFTESATLKTAELF